MAKTSTSRTSKKSTQTINEPVGGNVKGADEPADIMEWRTKVLKLMARVSSYYAISVIIISGVYNLWTNATGICLPQGHETTILGILEFFGAIIQLGYFEAKFRKTNGNKGWLF